MFRNLRYNLENALEDSKGKIFFVIFIILAILFLRYVLPKIKELPSPSTPMNRPRGWAIYGIDDDWTRKAKEYLERYNTKYTYVDCKGSGKELCKSLNITEYPYLQNQAGALSPGPYREYE